MNESDLYPPLKQYLQSQGYEIKGEVGHCDVTAIRDADPPLIVELKLSLNLTALLQAVDRLALTPNVYIGVPRDCSALRRKRRQVLKLFRLLGLGLISIDPLRNARRIDVLLDPSDYTPRVSKQRQVRLLAEFERRVGDPNLGGSTRRRGIMTAYRQRALRVAFFLDSQGPMKASDVAVHTEETTARDILYRDVYGWFDRISRGVYALSPRGKREIHAWRPSEHRSADAD